MKDFIFAADDSFQSCERSDRDIGDDKLEPAQGWELLSKPKHTINRLDANAAIHENIDVFLDGNGGVIDANSCREGTWCHKQEQVREENRINARSAGTAQC